MNKKRIAILTPLNPLITGGVERVVLNTLKRISNKNPIEVFCTDPTIKHKQIKKVKNILINVYPPFPKHNFFFSYQLLKDLKKKSFDIIHAHGLNSAMPLIAALASKSNTKLIFQFHAHPKGSTKIKSFLRKSYELIFAKYLTNKAAKIICVSEYEKNLVIKKSENAKAKLVVIPNGVDIKRFQKAKPFKFDGRLILYVGRLEKYKNVQLTIKALQFLPKEFSFYILGNGPYRKELEKLIEKLELKDRVKILSGLSDKDIARWYKTNSLFVTLSDIEAFGITVIEALASKKPVIVNESTALTEFPKKFPKSVTGVKAKEISSEELAKIILKQAGKNTKENLKDYNWDKIVKRLEEIYER